MNGKYLFRLIALAKIYYENKFMEISKKEIETLQIWGRIRVKNVRLESYRRKPLPRELEPLNLINNENSFLIC